MLLTPDLVVAVFVFDGDELRWRRCSCIASLCFGDDFFEGEAGVVEINNGLLLGGEYFGLPGFDVVVVEVHGDGIFEVKSVTGVADGAMGSLRSLMSFSISPP